MSKIKGTRNDDNLRGTNSADSIFTGNGGNDVIRAGGGNDTITIQRGAEARVNAGNGNDYIVVTGNAGDSTINGGKGNDIVSFKQSIDQFEVTKNDNGSFNIERADGKVFTVANVEKMFFNNELYVDPTINKVPVLADDIDNQSVNEGSAFSFVIPAGTFSDPNGDTLTFSATLENGSALPAWLSFNGTTGTFSGTPPVDGNFNVKVTASDGRGGAASDVFNLNIVDTTVHPPTKTLEEQFYDRYVAQDALYQQNGYYDVPTNKLGIDIALDYFKHLDGGGEAFDTLAKDSATRHQTIHDNFLGNLTEAGLTDRGLLQYAIDKATSMGLDISEVIHRPYYGGYDADGAAAEYPAVAWDYDHDINRDDYDSFTTIDTDQTLSAGQTDSGGDMFSGSGIPVDDFSTAVFNAGGISISVKADQYANVYADHVNGNVYTVNDGVSSVNANRADWSMYFSVEEGLNGSDQTIGNATTKGDFDVGIWLDIDPSTNDQFVFLANLEEIADSVTSNPDVFQNSWNAAFGFIKNQLLDNYGDDFEGAAEFGIELRLTDVDTGDVVTTNSITVNVVDNELI